MPCFKLIDSWGENFKGGENMSIEWNNFVVNGLSTELSNGHILADELPNQFLKNAGREAYHCVWDLEPRNTFKGYKGIVRPSLGFYWFDFDHLESRGENARLDVIEFTKWLGVSDVVVFFSGNKGFHVGVPEGYFGLAYSEKLPKIMAGLYSRLKDKFTTMDTVIFNASRLFRMPGSRHPKTGLYKRRITGAEIILDIDQIIRLARSGHGDINISALMPRSPRKVLPVLEMVLDMPDTSTEVSVSTVVNTVVSTTDEPYLPFQSYPKKACIKRLLESQIGEGSRHAASLVIVHDYVASKKLKAKCIKDVSMWAKNVGYDNDRLVGLMAMIDKAYSGEDKYTFGCMNTVKSQFCSAKCDVYSKLSKDKRPFVVDAKKNQITKSNLTNSSEGKLVPMHMDLDKNGKEILPEENEIAYELLAYYGDNIARCDTDIFVFNGKYWEEIDSSKFEIFYSNIRTLVSNCGTWQKYQNILKFFISLAPLSPISLHQPNPQRITFKNGTLAIDKVFGKWEIVFREHRKDDFSINYIPYEFDETGLEKNDVFDSVVETVLSGAEFFDRKRALSQMFGACLCPIYPRFFLPHGAGGRGKSTVIVLAKKLVSDSNYSVVQPHEFEGFKMESMAGKLVNIVTDIATGEPIKDAIIKVVEDRIPIRIDRKFKKALLAPLPAVHIFGANDIPPTWERGSGAHTRRWTFIKFDSFDAVKQGKYNKDIVEDIIACGMKGVINFAVEGLKDLLSNDGHYFSPQSSITRVEEWQIENDPISSFMSDIKNDDCDTCYNVSGGKMNQADFWKCFIKWYYESYNKMPKIGKKKFFSVFDEKGAKRDKSNGTRWIHGIALRPETMAMSLDVKSDWWKR